MPLASISNLVVLALISLIGVAITIALAFSAFLVSSSTLATKSPNPFVKYVSRHLYIRSALMFCVYFVFFWLINVAFDHFHILGPRWSIPKTLFMAFGFTLVFFFVPRRSVSRR